MDIDTAFTVWLILCIERPWENDWLCEFNQKDRKRLRREIKKILNKEPKTYKFNFDKAITKAFNFINESTEITKQDDRIWSKDGRRLIKAATKGR